LCCRAPCTVMRLSKLSPVNAHKAANALRCVSHFPTVIE
jgi:hypothetical protein